MEPNELAIEFGQQYFREAFNYDKSSGIVIWGARPRTDFKSRFTYYRWRDKHTDNEAGIIYPPTNRLRVSLREQTFNLDRLLWFMETGEDCNIYHKNGWNVDNTWTNLTPRKDEAAKPTKYGGEDLRLTHDGKRYVILTGNHAISIHKFYKTAVVRMMELAEGLECGWVYEATQEQEVR